MAIAILMAVAIPFLGIFLSSARNSALSQDTIKASVLAQRAMTSLRARTAAEMLARPEGLFAQEGKLKATYTIEAQPSTAAVSTGELTEPADYALAFTLKPSTVQVSDNGEFSLNKVYYAEISGKSTPYTYSFYQEDSQSLLASGVLADVNGNVNISVTLDDKRTPLDPQFLLQVKINPDVPDATKFNFYITDQGDAVSLYNVGIKPYYQYYNLSSQTASTSTRVLFKISVEAKYSADEETITRLVSYELK